MKRVLKLLVLVSGTLIACNVISETNEYDELASFTDIKGNHIGTAYVHYVSKNIFDTLKITNNKKETLYNIEKTKFISAKSLETEVYAKGFYGYKALLIKPNYIVIQYLRNNGSNVSDDITIKWYENEQHFGLLRAP